MSVDERHLKLLIEESEDLQVDALRDTRQMMRGLGELRSERRIEELDPELVSRFNLNRRNLLRRLGFGAGGVAARGVLGGGIGAAVLGILAKPAAADKALDVQILQTASSLEILAVATYQAALGLPFIKDGNKVVKAFAETTMKQHDEHRQAFQGQTEKLGGKVQDKPNPKYTPIVEQAKPTLKGPAEVVKLAMTLEEVATDTYLADLSLFEDKESRQLMATVMGVESQHLATLRAVDALLGANAANLIALPPDAAKLPAAAGSVAFKSALEPPDKASPPQEGAVK